MGMITNDWLEAIQPEFSKPYYKELYSFVTWIKLFSIAGK